MWKKTLLLVFLGMVTMSSDCDKKGACDTAEAISRLADLVVDIFTINNEDVVVNENIGTFTSIKNLLLGELCDEQENAKASFSDYQAFYRENPSSSWVLVGTSAEFEVPALMPDESHEEEPSVAFNVAGEYYLKARADVTDEVEEEDENNNEMNGSSEVEVRAAEAGTQIITVRVDANTDLEQMERDRKDGNFVQFYF
jgi:subtilase family serine protease